MPARSEAWGFDHRSVTLPGVLVIACSPRTRPGARVSGGGVWVVEPPVGWLVPVDAPPPPPPPVGPDAGGGEAGGGGGGLEASAAAAPAHRSTAARHAAASTRSPMPDLEIPTSTLPSSRRCQSLPAY